MHEFSTMTQIVEVVLKEASKHNADSVTEVRLQIGELTFLGVDQMKFAYKVLSEDLDILGGSDLIIEEVKATVRCDDCGYMGRIGYEDEMLANERLPRLSCPNCDQPVEIVTGNECLIKDIVVDIEG
ncbi:MAG: hydrogenase maturation nickel metallochaperone HypA [Halobacteriota archaeon]|nr:hydrogenase maturation nickel metallochaperone HypA [Halobacteriota archaeon]